MFYSYRPTTTFKLQKCSFVQHFLVRPTIFRQSNRIIRQCSTNTHDVTMPWASVRDRRVFWSGQLGRGDGIPSTDFLQMIQDARTSGQFWPIVGLISEALGSTAGHDSLEQSDAINVLLETLIEGNHPKTIIKLLNTIIEFKECRIGALMDRMTLERAFLCICSNRAYEEGLDIARELSVFHCDSAFSKYLGAVARFSAPANAFDILKAELSQYPTTLNVAVSYEILRHAARVDMDGVAEVLFTHLVSKLAEQDNDSIHEIFNIYILGLIRANKIIEAAGAVMNATLEGMRLRKGVASRLIDALVEQADALVEPFRQAKVNSESNASPLSESSIAHSAVDAVLEVFKALCDSVIHPHNISARTLRHILDLLAITGRQSDAAELVNLLHVSFISEQAGRPSHSHMLLLISALGEQGHTDKMMQVYHTLQNLPDKAGYHGEATAVALRYFTQYGITSDAWKLAEKLVRQNPNAGRSVLFSLMDAETEALILETWQTSSKSSSVSSTLNQRWLSIVRHALQFSVRWCHSENATADETSTKTQATDETTSSRITKHKSQSSSNNEASMLLYNLANSAPTERWFSWARSDEESDATESLFPRDPDTLRTVLDATPNTYVSSSELFNQVIRRLIDAAFALERPALALWLFSAIFFAENKKLTQHTENYSFLFDVLNSIELEPATLRRIIRGLARHITPTLPQHPTSNEASSDSTVLLNSYSLVTQHGLGLLTFTDSLKDNRADSTQNNHTELPDWLSAREISISATTSFFKSFSRIPEVVSKAVLLAECEGLLSQKSEALSALAYAYRRALHKDHTNVGVGMSPTVTPPESSITQSISLKQLSLTETSSQPSSLPSTESRNCSIVDPVPETHQVAMEPFIPNDSIHETNATIENDPKLIAEKWYARRYASFLAMLGGGVYDHYLMECIAANTIIPHIHAVSVHGVSITTKKFFISALLHEWREQWCDGQSISAQNKDVHFVVGNTKSGKGPKQLQSYLEKELDPPLHISFKTFRSLVVGWPTLVRWIENKH